METGENIIETVKPSMIRKYTYEYFLIALAVAVTYQQVQIMELNKYIRSSLVDTIAKVSQVTYESTNATTQFLNYQKYKQ